MGALLTHVQHRTGKDDQAGAIFAKLFCCTWFEEIRLLRRTYQLMQGQTGTGVDKMY